MLTLLLCFVIITIWIFYKRKPFLDITLKLVLALLCGVVIGYERDIKHKNAGIRTYMTICLSTTIVMIVASYYFKDTISGNISRMAAEAIQGIGFLGAGLIINKQGHLEGITSAAIMWCTAIIGLAIGYGLYFVAILATLVLLIIGNIIVMIFHKIDECNNSFYYASFISRYVFC